MSHFVIIKGIEKGEDNRTVSITQKEASTILAQWKNHEPVQVGSEIIPYTRILTVQFPEPQKLLAEPASCGKCWKGWRATDRGYAACSCNPRNQQIMREYIAYLNKQEWYTNSLKEETRVEREQYFKDDPFWNETSNPPEAELGLAI